MQYRGVINTNQERFANFANGFQLQMAIRSSGTRPLQQTT